MNCRLSAKSFKQNFKWNEFNTTQYFNLVFCYWDFSVDSEESVKIKHSGFVMEAKTSLVTDEEQRAKSNMRTSKSTIEVLRYNNFKIP